jgi:TolA-binding protein
MKVKQISCFMVVLCCGLAADASAASYEGAYALEVSGKYAEAISQYSTVLKDPLLSVTWPKAMFRMGQSYLYQPVGL